jgi:CheY-like chemotaxis protein
MNPTDTTPPTEPVTPPAEPVTDAPAAPPVDPAPAAPATEPAPAAEPVTPAEPAAAAAPEAAAPSNGTKRILLVEDDDSLAGVYVARLQAEGFDVRRVANGEEALATALSYKPDLALLDVMMPKVSGFDVLDIIRNTPETANLKIIMLTALSQESDLERAKQLGVDEYLIKSQVVIADVVDRIRAHLS